jgi:hypothetical protein
MHFQQKKSLGLLHKCEEQVYQQQVILQKEVAEWVKRSNAFLYCFIFGYYWAFESVNDKPGFDIYNRKSITGIRIKN